MFFLMVPAVNAGGALGHKGIELNPGTNQVSVTYTQVNITIMFFPMVPAAGAGGALDHRRD